MIKIILLVAYFISLFFIMFWLLVFLEQGAKDNKRKHKILPTVSICIPAYNEEKNIEETINHVLNLDYPKGKVEIIAVDDGSKDKTAEIVRKIIEQNKNRNIKLIRQENKGKGSAMNSGLNIAKGMFFVTLDADSLVSKDALKKLIPHFDKDTAAVLPLVKVKDRETIMQKVQYCEYLVNFFYKKLMGNLNCIHVTPGPFSVFKTAVIKEVGGFDEDNLVEDLEMALRLQKNNYPIKQILSSEVETRAPPSILSLYKQRNRWYKGSLLNLASKEYRGMLFNPKYGDLGFFQLPMVFVSAILSITLFTILIWIGILKPLFSKVYNLSFVQFDFMPLIKKSVYGVRYIAPVDIDMSVFFYGIIIFAAAFLFVLLAFRYTGKSIKQNLKSLLVYLLIYPTIIGIIWIGVVIDLLRGKIQKW